ncbi:MAG: carboxypeptidase-like regulatory domain-containing protein [Bryobacteraceae bacterium]|jgi:hypothetical protein
MRARLHAATITLLLLAWPAIAQDARIAGRVTDSRQTAVADAVVTATLVDSEAVRQVLSNAEGHFQIGRLPPGQYRIEVVKPGFKPLLRSGVGLGAGAVATLDLKMAGTAVSESVGLEVRQDAAGFPVVYVCGPPGDSGCERPFPDDPGAMLDLIPVRVYLP